MKTKSRQHGKWLPSPTPSITIHRKVSPTFSYCVFHYSPHHSSLTPLIILLWSSFDHKLLSIFIYEIANKLMLRICVAKVIPNLNGKICTTLQCVKNISHYFQQDSKFFEKKSLKWPLAKWSTSSLIGALTAHMGVFVSFTPKER